MNEMLELFQGCWCYGSGDVIAYCDPCEQSRGNLRDFMGGVMWRLTVDIREFSNDNLP